MGTRCKWFLFSIAALLAVSSGTVAASAKSTNNHPSAVQTSMLVEGVNDQGWIVGKWIDSAGNAHWVLMNPFLPAVSEALVPHATKAHVWAVHMNRF
jgi:hypothetical protein